MNYSKIKFVLLSAFLPVLCNLQAQSIKVEEYKLDNGLTIILHEDHTNPEVFGMVAVKAGGKNDPEDATGMAHYQEHVLFKGTQELGTTDWEKEKPHIEKIYSLYDELGKTDDPVKREEIQMQINEESLKAGEYAIPNELSNLIRSIGGTDLNAGTGPDMTVFYNKFPPNQMNKWLELYSHRFINPVFRSFQAELEIVYEEKNMYSDNFIMPLFEEFNKNFFKQHPYGQQTLIGTVDDLKNPSLTKMHEFFNTYYVANNMVLVLSGDFNIEKIKPVIEEKFGKWNSGEIPEQKKYIEEPFNGRELVVRKMSPVKLGLLGFRTPPNGHEDEIAMEVCNGILSNENSTGLLDKLILDNKMMAAEIFQATYNDYSSTIILIVPKIIGQKLETAEGLVLAQLDSLRNGNFDDWMVEAIKTELYKNFELELESNEYKAMIFAMAFGQSRNINEVLKYPEKIKKITKDDIIRVANKYYGKNYLAFLSKMGFPKKEKIDKPDFEPLDANTNAESVFAKRFEKMKADEPVEKYVDFEKDVKTTYLGEYTVLYAVNNPKNDIFTLTIKFGIGSKKSPLLNYASDIMNYSGTKEFELSEYKKEFGKIGCSYNIYSDQSYTYIELDGIEEKLPDALKLISQLLNSPVLKPEKLEILFDEEKTNRKLERSEPDNVADALYEYIRYKNQSDYIDRLSFKELKKLNTDSLVSTFLKASEYETEIHYCGKTGISKLKNIISANLQRTEPVYQSESPVVRDVEKYNSNKIYFVNKKKALQSKIYFLINGKQYEIGQDANIDAFNMYFGGGFSGLVLQEIREYRSMAYSAGALFRRPPLQRKEYYFVGYIGTQADKTNSAIDVFVDLVRNMPKKSERMQMIQDYLKQSALTSRPDFRELSQTVVDWRLKGYTDDPAKIKIPEYEKLTFNNITRFYSENVKSKPMIICIVGDKKRIDMDELKKYGEIINVKESSLFTK